MTTFLEWLFGYNSQNNNSAATEAFKQAQTIIATGGEQNEYLLSLLDLAIKGGITEAYESRAFCLKKLGFHYDAIVDFDSVINSYTRDSNLVFSRGHSKAIVGDFEGAIEDLRIAVYFSTKERNLDGEFTHELSRRTWESATQFYKQELQVVIDKQASSQLPHLKEYYSKRIAAVKRRANT